MELFELRYFLGVAQTENIHRASENLRVSPASLSKAIARIEAELSVRLFSRESRRIRLTEQGLYLKAKAVEILRMEEAARLEIAGLDGALRVVIAGPEVLLAHFAFDLIEKVRKRHPRSIVEYQACTDRQAALRVSNGDAHLAIVSGDAPRELTTKTLGETEFKTAVGPKHPLHARAKNGQIIPVAEILKHGFVCPSQAWLGQVGLHQSSDGWRDDQFPRRIEHQTSSLKLLEQVVCQGKAIAYLPDYLVADLKLAPLKISGCPYHCTQVIRLAAKRPKEVGWIQALF